MLSTLIFALIPIFVTIGLGYLAARRGIFNDQDSKKFVKLGFDLHAAAARVWRAMEHLAQDFDCQRAADGLADAFDDWLLFDYDPDLSVWSA